MSNAPQQPYGDVPPPPSGAVRLTSDQRNWGVVAHLSAFVGALVALAFTGPLLVWLVRKDRDRFVEHHAREALNFNLTMFGLLVAWGVATFVIGVLTLGIGFLVVGGLGALLALPVVAVWIWCPVQGALHASRGEAYHYPLTVRLVR